MTNGKVDVLADIDAARYMIEYNVELDPVPTSKWREYWVYRLRRHDEARAAVAGLIEAAKVSADQAARIRCNCCGSDEEGAEIAERLRSALGRIGG